MPIIQTVGLHQFRQAFADMGRSDQFSYGGLELLYNYLEDLSEDLGEPIELDVVALCCDYQEFENIEDLREQLDYPEGKYPEWDDIREDLEYRTTLIVDDYDDPQYFIIQIF